MAFSKVKQAAIYRSRRHVLVTLLVIIIPFVFFLLFSRLAKIATTSLFLDLTISVERLAVAYVAAALLGWLLAVCFYQGRRATLALPLFDVLQSFPTFAALPVATLAWGPSDATVIIVLVMTIIWPIFFSILSSLKLIKHDWQEAVAIAGLSRFDYVRLFILPVTTPGLITGSIIGLGEGWEALVATEIIVGAKPGLGSFFEFFARHTIITTFGIVGFLIFIFSLNKLIWLPLLEWSHQKMEE